MKVLPLRKPICSWPANPQTPTPTQSESRNGDLPATTMQWHFKKDATQSAMGFVSKLKIHKQLADAGGPIQKLLRYEHFEEGAGHVVHAEFESISCPLLPTWRHVNECLDAMISCFSALAEIHARNVYHGNPCIENFIFQHFDYAGAGMRSIKGYLTNFHDCGYINEDQTRCAKDVQIALSDFGGQLLMVAENSGFTQIRFLKMHLEAQVNFADQEELDALENAPTLLNHLCTLRTLLKLRQGDYPRHYQPAWGPLDQKQVLMKHQELQQRKKAPNDSEVKTRKPLELSNATPKNNQNDESKNHFYSTRAAGFTLLTAGAVMTLLSIRAKQTDKK